MPHNIIHGDACFAYFNKIWDIPPAFNEIKFNFLNANLIVLARGRPISDCDGRAS
jgi:hypothetical protein